ncbi:sigma-70 family RNA polymerase sigma factor [Gemmata sp. JC717]|uniref:sigma-70 family RNA polymerase sigma factor n=1 Tax=Gemmata algarum TaxID=2975278 RepID=UPI0021BB4E4F|nr:sigma-70 family RNA polymerase sigma factor [Gemmata algarum]MDY3556106.1 sigma-70 family RNA polymerase sigma factor [Gemmata algarum]
MSQSVLTAAVTRARRAARADSADGELVTRFGATGDPDAFAQLVRRHGPMVSAVCRRITRHRHDAEDAFQAAFLVLARKAGELDPPGAVGGWLFGVAVNTARAARRRSARRCARESLTAAPPEVGGCEPEPDFDTRAAVADALAELPERYRALVVACDLRGESQAVVARQLGMPVGTVYSRLSTARRLLAERLRRRGVGAASGAAALGSLAPDAAALPPISDCPSASVTELTEAIMAQGFALKWKLAACVLLVGVTLGLGAEPFKPAPATAPAPRPADESRLVLGFGGHIRLLKPDGTEVSRVTGAAVVKAGADMPTREASIGYSSRTGWTAAVSATFGPHGRAAPDGRLPLETRKGLYLLTPGTPPVVAPVKAAKGGEALFASGEVPYITAWSPDGKKAIGSRVTRPLIGPSEYEHVLIDLASGSVTELKLPRYHWVVDWAPDGSWFLTIRDDHSWSLSGVSTRRVLCKVSADGKTSEVLFPSKDATEPPVLVEKAALSPDGKRVAYQHGTETAVKTGKETVGAPGMQVVVLDLARNTRTVVASEPGSVDVANEPFGVRWSPDGTRIGFLYEHRRLGEGLGACWRVGVVGADETGAKTVYTTDRTEANLSLKLFDWR